MKKLVLLFTLFSLGGCANQSIEKAERPNGVAIQTSPQGKYASASHWKILANYEAKGLVSRLNKAVYIENQNISSPFSDTFYNLLTSSLVQNNAIVVKQRIPSVITVSYNVNVVTHDYSSLQDESSSLGGEFVYFLTTFAMEIVKAPFYAIKDQMQKNHSTISEIIVTTQAFENNLILFSNSNVYYIESKNDLNYIGQHYSTNVVTIPVVGD